MTASRQSQRLESTLSAKGQTTIPGPVRKRLGLEPGDVLRYEVTSEGTIQLHKVRRIDVAWAQAIEGTLSEWLSEADDDL